MRNSHRMFLQSFMSKGVLDGKEVKQLYKLVCERYNEPVPVGEEDWRRKLPEFVHTINTAIKPFHMQIRKGVSEENGANYYCLVNLQDSPITRMASDYTPNELELFKKIVGSIVASSHGFIGSTEALNLTHQLGKKMTKEAAEDMLRRMTRDRWMTLTEGHYSLAIWAILELEQYIIKQYPNLATMCNLCKKLCLQGQSCEQCDTKLHRACAEKFFTRRSDVRCPGENCDATWDDYATQDSVPSQPTQEATAAKKRKTRP